MQETKSVSNKIISQKVKIISALDVKSPERILTGIDELDRVLGGGLVPGGVALIGGQPGIGNSFASSCRKCSKKI